MKAENRGGKRAGAGRPKRTVPLKNTTVAVEPEIILACRTIHGTLANALRYAAKYNTFVG